MNSEIIVSAAEHAETAADLCEGKKWIVEGDFGFLGAFDSRSEAYRVANDYAEQANAIVKGNE